MRMLGPRGNPQARNLFESVAYLQRAEGVRFEVWSSRAASRTKRALFASEFKSAPPPENVPSAPRPRSNSERGALGHPTPEISYPIHHCTFPLTNDELYCIVPLAEVRKGIFTSMLLSRRLNLRSAIVVPIPRRSVLL